MRIKISAISYKYILATLTVILVVSAGCKSKSGNTDISAIDSALETYTCPMHLQLIAHQPGNCPICGMALVKRESANREISNVDLSTLLQSTNSIIVSSIPVTSLQHSAEQMQIEALGRIEYDTRFVKTIPARISGRVEKLYVKYRYQQVHAGDKVMDIYSPELLNSQENLLFILRNDPSNTTLINAAKQRLLLLGMSGGQLQQVMTSGKALFTVSVYSNYTGHVHEAGNMKEGAVDRERAVVAHDQAPEVTEPGVSAFYNPAPSVAPQRSAILRRRFLSVRAMWHDQFNTPLPQSFAQRIAVIGFVGDYP